MPLTQMDGRATGTGVISMWGVSIICSASAFLSSPFGRSNHTHDWTQPDRRYLIRSVEGEVRITSVWSKAVCSFLHSKIL